MPPRPPRPGPRRPGSSQAPRPRSPAATGAAPRSAALPVTLGHSDLGFPGPQALRRRTQGPTSGKEGKQTWGGREPRAVPSARRGQGSGGQAVRWALSGPRRPAARALSAGLEAAARPRPASHVATPPRRPGSPPPPLANHTEARGGGGALERMLLGFLGVSGRSQRGYGGLPDGAQGPDVEEAGYLYSSWRLLFFLQGC